MSSPVSQAVALHLAGAELSAIARQVQLTPEQTAQVVQQELAVRQPGLEPELAAELERINTLWRVVYAEAVQKDAEPQVRALALQLSKHRLELQARARLQAPRATPAANIRDAWGTLADGAVDAAESLLAVARGGRTESARVTAALAVLGRVGITERIEVAASVRMQTQVVDAEDVNAGLQSPRDIIRGRLQMLAERKQQIDALPD